ncbi:MAG TPA: UDP-3-O-(3-hydroxymyristoyl)glucosamine N-acyltransferase [Blastocatellia bacterium]|nr:UDP-3-O-(3-hydroxymyristoyl)glucosamine N-acyltransferase [Blastocatellia bacterium]
MKLGEIARLVGGEAVGDAEIEITGLATIEEAGAGDLTFLSNPKYRRHLAATRASAVVTADPADIPSGRAGIISPHPYLTFAHALGLFFSPPPLPPGLHPSASIAPSAVLGREVAIGPFTFVGEGARIGDGVTLLSHCAVYPGAEIGDDSFIHSHCVIRERCRLGRRVTLQNHAVIGADGFGYARRPNRSWHKIPQTGVVVLEDDVEVGAGSVIDRATIGETRVERGAKIDNLVQVGHGSRVGQDTLLCAQVGLAGSTRIGREVILGGQVGAAGHLSIGDRVVATAQTGIPNSIPPDRTVSGYPAIDNREWLKASALFAQLPLLRREIRRLRRELDQLTRAPH